MTWVVAVLFFVAPLAAEGQSTGTVVVGFLSSGSQAIAKDFVMAFRQGLNETGFIDGQSVHVEYRWADGHYDRLPSLATDLVNRGAAVIAAGAPPAALAIKSITSTIPIVFIASDAVPLGLVVSLNRPGGNATASILATSLWPKRLELMSELAPKAAAIAMLVNGSVATEKQPRGFNIDSSSGATCSRSASSPTACRATAIDPESGKLTKLKEYPMGKNRTGWRSSTCRAGPGASRQALATT